MRVLGLTLTACVVLALSACSGGSSGKNENKGSSSQNKDNKGTPAGEKTNADKIIGKWELVKSGLEAAVGETVEFAKDGKMKMTTKPIVGKDKEIKYVGKEQTIEGTYKVEGDKITVTMKGPDGKVGSDTAPIKTLTDTKLVIEVEKGKFDEYQRK